jgi:hypothetical protein
MSRVNLKHDSQPLRPWNPVDSFSLVLFKGPGLTACNYVNGLLGQFVQGWHTSMVTLQQADMDNQDLDNLTLVKDETPETVKDADQNGPAVSVAASEEERDPEGWDNDDAWEQLLHAISNKICTPFLGAGACAGVLPLGTTIAERWAKEFDYPFSDCRNLPRVAQFVGIMKSGPFLPRLRIKAEFKDKVPDHTNPDEPHRVLAGLKLPVYITTNYDSFMYNELLRQKTNPNQQCCEWHKAKDISKTRAAGPPPLEPTPENPVVYHLHGYLADPMSMVLTEDDYLNFLINISEESVIPSHIEAAFGTDRSFLFVGYSLEDMSFKVLFRKFGRKMASSPGDRHIAVQLHPDEGLTESQKRRQREFLEKQFGTQNVKIYWGKASTFLRSLRLRWAAFKP